MSSPMKWSEAFELCQLRLKEDGITARVALREFQQLTQCGLRDAEPYYRKFQEMEKAS